MSSRTGTQPSGFILFIMYLSAYCIPGISFQYPISAAFRAELFHLRSKYTPFSMNTGGLVSRGYELPHFSQLSSSHGGTARIEGEKMAERFDTNPIKLQRDGGGGGGGIGGGGDGGNNEGSSGDSVLSPSVETLPSNTTVTSSPTNQDTPLAPLEEPFSNLWKMVAPHMAIVILATGFLLRRLQQHVSPLYIGVWALALVQKPSGFLNKLSWTFAVLSALSFINTTRVDQIIPVEATGSNYALVTGASSGIGRNVAIELGSRGFNLILVARREDKLSELASELGNRFNVKTMRLTVDLAAPEAAARIYKEVTEKKLQVDILVNNAGFTWVGDIEEMPLDKIQDMTMVNTVTPTKLLRLFGEAMATQGKGRVLMVSSISSQPTPSVDVYSATKAFLNTVCMSTQYRLMQKGVAVTCALPGAVSETDFDRPEAHMNDLPLVRTIPIPGFADTSDSVAKKIVTAMLRGDAVYSPGIMNSMYVNILSLILPRHLLFRFNEIMWLPDPSGILR